MNHFDSNGGDGIVVLGKSLLVFGGGTASDNGHNGVELGGCNSSHYIANLEASGNHVAGIKVSACYGTPLSLTLRSSILVGNVEGLFFDYGAAAPAADAAAPLDIGTPDAAGSNQFAQPGTVPDAGAGVFLCNARGPMTQQAVGDTFATALCPSALESSCSVVPPAYVDVAYTMRAGGGASPIVCPQ